MVKNPCIRSRSVLYTGTSQLSRGCWQKPEKYIHSTSTLFSRRRSKKQERLRSLLYQEHFSYQNPVSHASRRRSRSDEPCSLAGTGCYESCGEKMRSEIHHIKCNTNNNHERTGGNGCIAHSLLVFIIFHLSEMLTKNSQKVPNSD